jgi:hypothetical protein
VAAYFGSVEALEQILSFPKEAATVRWKWPVNHGIFNR